MTPRHNLPSRPYRRLIGRDTELADIKGRISARSRDWIVAIEGIGGLGKTALALEAGWQCVEEASRRPAGERFSAVIWATAKRETLTARGIVPEAPTLTSLDDLFAAMACVLEAPQLLRAPLQQRWREAWRVLEHAGRVLLILDNLEEVDDPALLVFLRDLPGQSKVIATVRFHEDLPEPIQLPPLDKAALTQLAREGCAEYNVRLNDDQQAYIVQSAQGLPLAVHWVIGLMADQGIEQALGQLRSATGDLPRYLFERVVDRLRRERQDAYLALLASTFFDVRAGADVHALAATLGFSGDQCKEALRVLDRFHLVAPGSSGRGALLPIAHKYVKEYVKECVKAARTTRTADEEWERAARGRWVAFYEELAWRVDDATMHARLQREVPNVLLVLAWLQEHAADRDYASHLALIFGQVQELLFDEGRWDELQSYAKGLVRYVESAPDESSPDANAFTSHILVDVLQTPIDVYSRRADYDEGERWLERVAKLASRPTEWLKAELLLAEARLAYNDRTMRTAPKVRAARHFTSDAQVKEYLLGLVYRATDRVERALAIFRASNQPERVILAHMTLANCYRAADRFKVAEHHYEETLHELGIELARSDAGSKRGKLGRWEAVVRGNLALMKGRQGRLLDACNELRSVLPRLVETTDLIEAYAALAFYEYIRGNTEDAIVLRERADLLRAQLDAGDISLCREEEQWEKRDALHRAFWHERMSQS